MKQDVKEIYLDNHLLIVNKPYGLLTQANETNVFSLQEIAKEYIRTRFQKPGNVFLEPIHRLDRPVSGIVVFARTSKALSRLNKWSREGKFSKTYLAVVEGELQNDEDMLFHMISHEDHFAKVHTFESGLGKPCRLKYKVVKRTLHKTFLEITLLTGRYHQIRAQLSAIGHPILGDKRYGSHRSLPYIFLHHQHLEILHPITLSLLQLEAPLFESWDEIY